MLRVGRGGCMPLAEVGAANMRVDERGDGGGEA